MGKKPTLFRGQNYEELHKHYTQLDALFNDSVFPATNTSLGHVKNLPENVQWKRPGSMCDTPRLFGNEWGTTTVAQGRLSTNYFVSACSILSGIGELVHQVVPDYWNQEWDAEKSNYVGIFHFRFWRFGEWVDVVVDDLVPTIENELIFTRSSRKDEFWTALVEKAYAKLHGSYEALEEGHITDALVDFTGGVSEVVDLVANNYAGNLEKLASLFETLMLEMSHHSVMCCTITEGGGSPTSSSYLQSRNEMGLYRGHAYAITAVKKINLGETSLRTLFQGREKCCMVRLRDPRGEGAKSAPPSAGVKPSSAGSTKEHPDTEGESASNFAYSTSQLTRLLSKSSEWAQIKDSERQRMGLLFDDEGEFWMPLEDFVSNFTELVIVRLLTTNVFTVTRPWSEASATGVWSVGARGTSSDRSGGGKEYPDTYLRNPQFLFDISLPEEEFIVQMLQWDNEAQIQPIGLQKLLISFMIIKVEENRKYRLHRQWDYCPTVVCLDHMRKRELFYRGFLSKGRYIIVPTANKPGETGNFLIRLFTSKSINLRCIKLDLPKVPWWSCCYSHPQWFTVIHIKGAEQLSKVNRFGSCDPYCIIKCEGHKYRTPVIKNAMDPVWNCAFIFYRKNIDTPIEIQVYSHNMLWGDRFLGQVQLPAPVNQHPSLLRADLTMKGEETPTSGHLNLDILTDDNMLAL